MSCTFQVISFSTVFFHFPGQFPHRACRIIWNHFWVLLFVAFASTIFPLGVSLWLYALVLPWMWEENCILRVSCAQSSFPRRSTFPATISPSLALNRAQTQTFPLETRGIGRLVCRKIATSCNSIRSGCSNDVYIRSNIVLLSCRFIVAYFCKCIYKKPTCLWRGVAGFGYTRNMFLNIANTCVAKAKLEPNILISMLLLPKQYNSSRLLCRNDLVTTQVYENWRKCKVHSQAYIMQPVCYL